jgi:NADPH-dependent glutamate synthase beta subunit-like oxidoreductase
MIVTDPRRWPRGAVFAGGDADIGPDLVVTAMAAGRAARSIGTEDLTPT